MSELTKRLIVAAIGIPIALAVIYFGSFPFYLVISIISALALFEFFSMAEKKGYAPHRKNSLFFSLTLQALFMLQFAKFYNSAPFMIAILMFLAFILVTFIIELFSKKSTNPLGNISVTITGTAYVIFFFLSLYILREFDKFLILFLRNAQIFGMDSSWELLTQFSTITNRKWGYLILTIFGSVWLCDSAAYFVGKAIGKHKLYERISPKKTIEGAIGGLVFAVLAFAGLGYLLIPELTMLHLIVSGLIVGTIGQIGDLAESMLKRDAGIKDSSNLLPGHGGALDRFDSILFVAPSLFIYYCAILYFNISL